jgi:glycosyltransferase involved in cell wall biosynthesis
MKRPKILFDARILRSGFNKSASRSGIYFVAYNIFRNLLKNKSVDVALYCESADVDLYKRLLAEENNFSNIRFYTYDKDCFPFCEIYNSYKKKRTKARKTKKLFKKLFYQFILTILAPFYHFYKHLYEKNKFFGYNCFLSPMHKIPDEVAECKRIKKYTVLHDVIPLVLTGKVYKHSADSWFTQLINSLNKNDFYICISEYTRKDFLKHCPNMDKDKTFVNYLACNERFKPQNEETIKKVKQKYGIENKKYIFSLGNIEPRKNIVQVLNSFIKFIDKNNINDLYIVLSGADLRAMTFEEFEAITEKYKDKVIRTGYINDEDVAPLYSGAQCFVYTSKYEGFGLPPLEAMSCGCPVIASNATSLPEVVGNAAIKVDCDSEEQHIKAFETYYYDKEKRNEYIQKGLIQAKQFSWDKCCQNIINIMKKNL